MKFSFRVPAGKDMLWTDEAAESVIGQQTKFRVTDSIVYPTEITAAHVEDGGQTLVLSVEVDTDKWSIEEESGETPSPN